MGLFSREPVRQAPKCKNEHVQIANRVVQDFAEGLQRQGYNSFSVFSLVSATELNQSISRYTFQARVAKTATTGWGPGKKVILLEPVKTASISFRCSATQSVIEAQSLA